MRFTTKLRFLYNILISWHISPIQEPNTFTQAYKQSEWIEVMKNELKALELMKLGR